MDQAQEAGYPVLLKPSAGGGGRGMRLVRSPREMETSLPLARSEAQAAFGDDSIYFEKWIEESRHVEVQVLVDQHGNGVHLGERDCSIQRRHQKIIEEAPSPAMDDAARERLRDLAIRAVVAAGYESAGTLEFLLDKDGNFYFIEINCRIQVEHPVTEMLTGLDLIAEQIRLAAGERLSLTQEQVRLDGHAIEFRINAEDPGDNFSPQTGVVDELLLPGGPGVRVDTHLYAGYEVPPFYDSLLAKLVVWGDTRPMALARARRALAEFTGRRPEDQPALPSWDDRQRRIPGGGDQHQPARPGWAGGLRGRQRISVVEPMSEPIVHRTAGSGRHHADPSAPLSVPAGRPRDRAGARQASGRDQERDRQRAPVHRAFPRAADHARRPDGRGAGADLRRGGADAGRIPRQDRRSSRASTSAASAAWCSPATRCVMEVTVEKLRGMFGRARAVASVDGEVAVEGTLSIIIPRDQSLAGGLTDG